MKQLTRQQAEAIYAMWRARAERLEAYSESVMVSDIHDWYRWSKSDRLAEEMRERIHMLAKVVYPERRDVFIESWGIAD